MQRGRTASAARPRMFRNFAHASTCLRLVPAFRPAPTRMGSAIRNRSGNISAKGRHLRDRPALPPKPPPHRLGIGPIRSVRTSAGRKSILPNPPFHRPLPRAHGTANGVQPDQYKRHGRHGRLPVHPHPCLAPAHDRMPRTGLPFPGLESPLANVHGPWLTASADATGHPCHFRNMPVHKPLLRLLRALHAFSLPVSRHLAPRLTLHHGRPAVAALITHMLRAAQCMRPDGMPGTPPAISGARRHARGHAAASSPA